jgi:hypothetical protein
VHEKFTKEFGEEGWCIRRRRECSLEPVHGCAHNELYIVWFTHLYTFGSSPYRAQLTAAEAAFIIMLGYHHHCASIVQLISVLHFVVVMLEFFCSCIKENNCSKADHCGAACIVVSLSLLIFLCLFL